MDDFRQSLWSDPEYDNARCCIGMLMDLFNPPVPLSKKELRKQRFKNFFARFNPRNYTYNDDLEW